MNTLPVPQASYGLPLPLEQASNQASAYASIGFEMTQKILLEQMLRRLYPEFSASVALNTLVQGNQLYPQALQNVVESIPRGCVVELGCGYGFTSNIIALLNPDTQVIGIDTRREPVQIAQKTIGKRKNLNFYCTDLAHFAPIACDLLILNVDVINDDLERTLEQVQRWVTPGGDVIIRTPHQSTHWKNLLKVLNPETLLGIIQRNPMTDLSFLDSIQPGHIESYLSEAGFFPLSHSATTEDARSLLQRLFTLQQSYTIFHAEKPLFPTMAEKPVLQLESKPAHTTAPRQLSQIIPSVAQTARLTSAEDIQAMIEKLEIPEELPTEAIPESALQPLEMAPENTPEEVPATPPQTTPATAPSSEQPIQRRPMPWRDDARFDAITERHPVAIDQRKPAKPAPAPQMTPRPKDAVQKAKVQQRDIQAKLGQHRQFEKNLTHLSPGEFSNRSTKDVLGFIFSKDWGCLAKEIGHQPA